MAKLLGHLVLLAAVCGTVLFINLGVPRLWDRDEPRNAGCAVEMMERADWVVPVFNGELRTHKPVLLYWLMLSAYQVWGISEFAARFPSAVAGCGTVLATYAIGRRLFGAGPALWAALILATSLMFDVAARAATPDSLLIFCSTLAMVFYVLGAFPGDNRTDDRCGDFFPRSWLAAAGMYAAMGLGVLAKGPVGLVLPTAVVGMFLLVMRLPPCSENTRPAWLRVAKALVRPFAPGHFVATCWAMRPITALLASLAVALPWYAWVAARTEGAWVRGFLLEHNLGRALEPMEGHGGSMLWYYPLTILVGFFPWSILTPPMGIEWARGVRERSGWRIGYVFLACWVGVYVGLFSLARTKLPSYITPSYPALALMAGCVVYRWVHLGEISVRWLRCGLVSVAAVGMAMAVGLPIAAHYFLPGEEWLGLVGLIPLAGSGTCWLLVGRRQHMGAAVSLAVTAIAFSVMLMAGVAVTVSGHQPYDRLLRAFAGRANAPVAAFGNLEPSWVFYARRPIRFYHDGQTDALRQFLLTKTGGFVITTSERLERLRPTILKDVEVLAECPYFLRDETLVLLGSRGGAGELADSASTSAAERLR